MDNYSVGINKPIKLKVEVITEAIPMTYSFLETTGQSDGQSDINPFNPSLKKGWKSLNKGETVKGKTLKVTTFLRFFNSFPNEVTFNLAIDQIKETYKTQLTGGTPSNYNLNYTLESQYSSKTCLIKCEATLI
jgi:hypothetical protein